MLAVVVEDNLEGPLGHLGQAHVLPGQGHLPAGRCGPATHAGLLFAAAARGRWGVAAAG